MRKIFSESVEVFTTDQDITEEAAWAGFTYIHIYVAELLIRHPNIKQVTNKVNVPFL